jgi:hypothetical protein
MRYERKKRDNRPLAICPACQNQVPVAQNKHTANLVVTNHKYHGEECKGSFLILTADGKTMSDAMPPNAAGEQRPPPEN